LNLLSIQIGLPRSLDGDATETPGARPWTSGIFKEPVTGPVELGPTGLAGDGQADLRVHGGPDKAVNVYPSEHYLHWREMLALECAPGAFGENFTLSGALEEEVCVGDVYALGSVHLEVSQPRQPCWKLARRWGVKDFALQVQRTGRTGWYFRVLEPGTIEAPATLDLVERPFPRWTVACANAVMHDHHGGPEVAASLAACPALAESWRKTLRARAVP
jgi:MOSC domain-containing protein YiiM